MLRLARTHLRVALALVVLALVACGGSGSGGDTASGSSTDDAPAADPSDFDRDADFVMAYPTPAKSLDPHLASPVNQISFLLPMYDTLTTLDNDFEPAPMLAESWEYSEDGKALTLKLREGVAFQDGTPVDAEAVKASLERAMTLEGSTAKGLLSSVAGVTAVDATTVEIAIAAGGAELPAALATGAGVVLNPKVLADPAADLAADPPEATGSGAYVLDGYVAGENIHYVRSENPYWDEDAASLASIEIQNVAGPATQNGVRTGELDAGLLSGSAINEGLQLVDQGAFEGTQFQSRSLNSLILVPEREKLADVRVRQAIAYAVDTEAIGTGLSGGTCAVTDQLVLDDDPTYSDGTDGRARDVQHAKDLLADAGVTDLTLNVAFADAGDFFALTAEAIQEQLSEVGITLELQSLPPADVVTRIANREIDAAVYPANPGHHLVGYVRTMLLNVQNIVPDDQRAAVEELATVAVDPAEDEAARNQAFADIWQMNFDEVWQIPICFQGYLWIHDDTVEGIDSMPLASIGGFTTRYLGKVAG